MRLHDLKPRPGAKHRRKRLGQGESSGHGKTSGRGGKGQTPVPAVRFVIGFEGGQMPLIRRIPKRGFNNVAPRTRYIRVNLESLNRFEDGARVDEAAIASAKPGLANGPSRQESRFSARRIDQEVDRERACVQRFGPQERLKPRAALAKWWSTATPCR